MAKAGCAIGAGYAMLWDEGANRFPDFPKDT
jgi:hypothetical protein